jgi:uncharacterized protein YdcH (DUF465 family)
VISIWLDTRKIKAMGLSTRNGVTKFNACIEVWGLLEVKLGNRKLTWGNNQENLIMSTIDRVFCNTELDAIYPLANTQAFARLGSDHTPLLWNSGLSRILKATSYKFEKWWVLREDFRELVEKSWNAPTKGKTAIDKWQDKVRWFRKTTKGWSRNIKADLRRLKKDLMEEYDSLDIEAENEALSDSELARMREIHLEMQKLWLKDEIIAKQRSRDRDIIEGDKNTAYFHAVANQRRRKTLIHSLDGPNGPTSNLGEMLEIATSFYKNIFQAEDRVGISLTEDFFTPEEKVSDQYYNMLDAPFSQEEIKTDVFTSYSDGAPCHDGLSFMFYQKFWVLVKQDILDLFSDLQKGELDLYRLNFAVLSLIPKEPDASTMKKFRPISLLNCILRSFLRL